MWFFRIAGLIDYMFLPRLLVQPPQNLSSWFCMVEGGTESWSSECLDFAEKSSQKTKGLWLLFPTARPALFWAILDLERSSRLLRTGIAQRCLILEARY